MKVLDDTIPVFVLVLKARYNNGAIWGFFVQHDYILFKFDLIKISFFVH